MFLALLLVTATFRPVHPTVGDRITIDFQKPVAIERSAAFEIVSQQGSRVVVRTFEPRPFVLSGTTEGVHFRNLVVPVGSVLPPKDSMKPAPLKPPQPAPWPREPFIAIAVAALLALGAWIGVYLMDRRRAGTAEPAFTIDPADRFRARVTSLRDAPPQQKWAALADAVREYLDSRGYGADLTTSELIAELGRHDLVSDLLRRGDLEKFSPWGPPAGDFPALAEAALSLPDEFEPKNEVAA